MQTLANKVAVVTGTAGIIGPGIAQALVEAGAAVVLCDVIDAAAERTAQAIRDAGGQAIYQRADVSQPGDMAALAAAAVDRFGRLDIWVNNAKADSRTRITELEPDEWDRVMNVCLKGAYLGAKYAIPRMIASGGGVIINIASVHALVAYPNCPAYDAAKGGVIALTRQIAADYAADGIRANAILPGLTVRDPGGAVQDWSAVYAPHYPLGRFGTPADVAGAVVFLAGAPYVSGAMLTVDGGLSARSPEYLASMPIEKQKK